MSHYVPDFDMEDDHNFNSTSSMITRHKVDDDILELLWQDGQVIAQPQSQRKPPPSLPPPSSHPLSPPPQYHLDMAEDEMATWLHYPLEDLYSELVCENQTSTFPPLSSARNQEPSPSPPPPPPPTTTTSNFGLFSRMRGSSIDLERASNLRQGSTMVDSNSIPALPTKRSVGEVSSAFPTGGGGGGERLEKDGGSGELTVSSSSGTDGSRTVKTRATTAFSDDVAGVEPEAEDRKRKRKEVDEYAHTTITGQDLEHDTDTDEKKHSRGHSTGKRSRAAEVHNLSERRRRDRINERMKALQELIPRCNKSDKASMLDEAIEYLKSLQMQVQMMSMGCNMVPMMYPGMQQYIPPMGMGMGIARPMIPYPPNLPGSNLPIAPGSQIGPRFAIPPVHMPSVQSSKFSANQAGNQIGDSIRGSYPVQYPPGMTQGPNVADPYQQYVALQQMQMQIQMQMQQIQAVQNQSVSQLGSSKPSTSKSEAHAGPSASKSEGEDDR